MGRYLGQTIGQLHQILTVFSNKPASARLTDYFRKTGRLFRTGVRSPELPFPGLWLYKSPAKPGHPRWYDTLNRSSAVVRPNANFITMKLDTPQFGAMLGDDLKTLVALFSKHGYEIRIAGGAVRDLLMGIQPHDIDFATTATPEQMKSMFTAEGIRMLNTKGEQHGTITARINDSQNFEITTLRIDVQTDGRHAKVQFTTDWMLDASRRDLTINSLFLGIDGTVYDYFGGISDMENFRVTFVGDPSIRIVEDYLRILRYFRFYGRIAKTPNDHDKATLQAIKENIKGLEGVSGERIWTELKKILTGNYVESLVPIMLEVGISPYIGLPTSCNVDEFQRVVKNGAQLSLQAITFVAALLNTQEEMMQLHARLKLSAYERDLGLFIVEHRECKPHEIPLRPYQTLVLKSKSNQKHAREWVEELFKYKGNQKLTEEFLKWEIPKFPVNGFMIKEKGIKGKHFSILLNKLLDNWIESNFSLSAEQLLEDVDSIMQALGIKNTK